MVAIDMMNLLHIALDEGMCLRACSSRPLGCATQFTCCAPLSVAGMCCDRSCRTAGALSSERTPRSSITQGDGEMLLNKGLRMPPLLNTSLPFAQARAFRQSDTPSHYSGFAP